MQKGEKKNTLFLEKGGSKDKKSLLRILFIIKSI